MSFIWLPSSHGHKPWCSSNTCWFVNTLSLEMHQIWTSTVVPHIFHTCQFYIRAITIFSNSKQLSVVELDSPPPENIAILFDPILFSLYVIFLLSILFYFSFEFLSLFPSHFFTHFTCLFGVHNGTHWMKLSNWPTRKCYIFKHFNFFGLLLVWRYVHISISNYNHPIGMALMCVR